MAVLKIASIPPLSFTEVDLASVHSAHKDFKLSS